MDTIYGEDVLIKMLSEGSAFMDFYASIQSLHKNNPDLLEKIVGICKRLEFVEELRYTPGIALIFNAERGGFQYHIERLCAYMATTCIEIAATRNYKPFAKWLKEAVKSISPSNTISSFLQQISSTNSEDELKKLLPKLIGDLHDNNYLDEAGLSRSFVNLLEALPEWLKLWLGDIYCIEVKKLYISAYFDGGEPGWIGLNNQQRVKVIAKYLYDQVRSKHTHTVSYYPTMERGGTLGVPISGKNYWFNTFYENGKTDGKVEYDVGIQGGYAESEILRLVMVITLRKWLGIVDTESFIDFYWDRSMYRRNAFLLLEELEYNLHVIEFWCARHLHVPTLQFPRHRGIGFLVTTESKRMGTFLENRPVSMVHEDLRRYQLHIEEIHKQIEDFNAQQKPGGYPLMEEDEFIKELVHSNEVVWLVSCIQNLRQVLPQIINHSAF